MYSTKSFCNISAFMNNAPFEISPIGEISAHAATFSRDIRPARLDEHAGLNLLVFSSKQETTITDIAPSMVKQALKLVSDCVRVTQGISGEVHQDELLNILVSDAVTGFTSVSLGRMVTNGERWLPAWISWSDSLDSRENEHIVWLAVDDFIADYPEYENMVVPPFDVLDNFFLPGSVVEAELKKITHTQMIERAETVKGRHPTTWRSSDTYTYHDALNPGRRIDVDWQMLGYGEAGDDPDIKRDTLANYILANSSRTREQWAAIFPDIFRRTEFIFTPLWDKYAADARILEHGIYSSIVSAEMINSYAAKGAHEYPSAHVKANAQAMPFAYRCAMVACIGHIENRDRKIRISDYYPDYMPVSTGSTDYGRMSLATMKWIDKMIELLNYAETWTSATRLPRGVYHVVRGGKNYISATVDRVLMLVLVKSDISKK